MSSRFRGAQTGLQFDPLRGIDIDSVYVQDPVEVRAGGAAGGPGVTENIAALHNSTRSHNETRHVQVHGFQALAVIDAHRVAKYIELLCEGDSAGSDSANRFAFRSA